MNEPAIATFHTFSEKSSISIDEQILFTQRLLLFSCLNSLFYFGDNENKEKSESWEWFLEKIKGGVIHCILSGAFHDNEVTQEAVEKTLEHYKIDLEEITKNLYS